MSKFKEGTLHTGTGSPVNSPKQAQAIYLAEQKKKGRPFNPAEDSSPIKALKKSTPDEKD